MLERFLLAQMFLSSTAQIDISRTEYEAAVQAITRLMHCVDAEEKFDGLIENYRELEKFILDEAFAALFSERLSDVESQAPRSTTARKLSNFLSSVRLYQDSIGRHAAAITNDETAADKVNASKSRQFDSSLSYRALDAIRNHAQHFALPVHGYTVGRQWTPDRDFAEHEFDPVINVAELAENIKFHPPKTLLELKQGPETLRLKPLIREYVENLSTVHHDFRQVTKTALDHHLQTIHELKAKLFTKFPDTRDIGIAVYPANDEGLKTAKETNLTKTVGDYLEYLQTKNRHLVSFARRRIVY